MITELFSLGVTAEALLKIDVFERMQSVTQFGSNFT